MLKEGGQHLAYDVLSKRDCLLGVIILNNTSLGDKGLYTILATIHDKIKEESTAS